MTISFLSSAIQQFEYYKSLGDRAFAQLGDDDLNWQYNDESNSIAIIIQHLHGNMLSRWTDFMSTDGEKETRKRDAEFEAKKHNREELMDLWSKGWDCLFDAIRPLHDEDLQKTIYIRSEPHSVLEAIHRQLAHYPYHVGQIVFIAKMIQDQEWKSLSIPRNGSKEFNEKMFGNK